jgi:hypothetical protein
MPKIRLDSVIKRVTDAIDLNLMSDADRANFDQRPPADQARYLGFDDGYKQNFDTPGYISTNAERTLSQGNASIVLGLDRPSNIFSGFGGSNNTHCAAIDLVAGRLGYRGASHTKGGQTVNADPNFRLDSARIYISQKSDPDGYFGLAGGSVGNTSEEEPRSTVALKADTVRLIGRENIKLVTRTDAANSQGAPLPNTFVGGYGIDLIALNDDKGLQPMVKGENLKECLVAIIGAIHDLRDLFDNFIEEDRKLTQALLKHTHYSPFFGNLTSPDFSGLLPAGIESLVNKITNVQLQLNTSMQKLTTVQTNYLEAPAGAAATKDGQSQYILSRYNNTN